MRGRGCIRAADERWRLHQSSKWEAEAGAVACLVQVDLAALVRVEGVEARAQREVAVRALFSLLDKGAELIKLR